MTWIGLQINVDWAKKSVKDIENEIASFHIMHTYSVNIRNMMVV
ncbi:hypothetical protein [Bacillus cereus group sp. BfR-BA-01349]